MLGISFKKKSEDEPTKYSSLLNNPKIELSKLYKE
jgi:hypothetical protein